MLGPGNYDQVLIFYNDYKQNLNFIKEQFSEETEWFTLKQVIFPILLLVLQW